MPKDGEPKASKSHGPEQIDFGHGIENSRCVLRTPTKRNGSEAFFYKGDRPLSIFLEHKKKVSSFESAAFFEFGGLWEASW